MRSLLLSFALLAIAVAAPAAAEYPCRWVYVACKLHTNQDLEEIRGIVATASRHGLNGMVLAGGIEHLDRQPDDYFQRLKQLKLLCAQQQVEIIPSVFSVGRGSALSYDRNLAEGLAVKDARFVVHGQEARLQTDFPVELFNGGFEEYTGNKAQGCQLQDQPGKVSFIDTQVAHSGRASLRFENLGSTPQSRVMFEVPVRPWRCYRVRAWIKTENLQPSRAFRIEVFAGQRSAAPVNVRVDSTGDWRPLVVGFNSREFDKVSIYAGVWNGKAGRFWLDDLQIEEIGLVNVLRRSGAPLLVRDADSSAIYQEGRDFAPVSDPQLDFHFDHEGPAIRLLPGSRIRDGQALRVSYYHGMAIRDHQVSVCMSEPKLYEIWAKQAEALQKHLAPKRWLLSMDEIREGGSCAACKARKMTMAQILGDCITKQCQIIHRLDPKAEVFAWSDMLDPNHNAHGNYYLVDGDFSGSWQYVPKDLRIVCWYYAKRRESLAHFSSLGFKILAGAYYDGNTLENPQGWLEALQQTPGAVGMMYTTWRGKYELLGPFGDLVSGRETLKIKP